jgi:hypothetical protein
MVKEKKVIPIWRTYLNNLILSRILKKFQNMNREIFQISRMKEAGKPLVAWARKGLVYPLKSKSENGKTIYFWFGCFGIQVGGHRGCRTMTRLFSEVIFRALGFYNSWPESF